MENGRSIPPAPMVMYWPGAKRNSMLGSSQIRNRSSGTVLAPDDSRRRQPGDARRCVHGVT